MYSRITALNFNLSRRMYSTPTFHENFKYNFKSNKNSNDLHTNKECKKKKSYEHMYKHLPIKSFEIKYKEIYANK